MYEKPIGVQGLPTVKQMKITSAECASGDLQNNIPWLKDFGPGGINDLDLILGLPDERLHGLTPATF